MLYCGFNLDQEGSSAQSSLAMKLLLEALFAALEQFSKWLTFRNPRISASCSGSGRSSEVAPRSAAGIIHFEKRCSANGRVGEPGRFGQLP
jgi:hypothetical protein